MDQAVTRAALALLLLAACVRPADRASATYDRILKGGWIVDGSGNPRWRGDVALSASASRSWDSCGARRPARTLDVSG